MNAKESWMLKTWWRIIRTTIIAIGALLTFFAVIEAIRAYQTLRDMLDDIGEMSLEEQDGGMAIYELSNSDSTRLYPVIFSMDDGNWKISIF